MHIAHILLFSQTSNIGVLFVSLQCSGLFFSWEYKHANTFWVVLLCTTESQLDSVLANT